MNGSSPGGRAVLPHRYPFVFVDRPGREGEPLRVLLTQGKRAILGGPEFPAILAVEIIAQGAALVDSATPGRETSHDETSSGETSSGETSFGESEPQAVYLAGCEVRFSDVLIHRPLTVGDELEVVIYEQAGAFGRLRRVAGRLCRRGEETMLVEAELMLST